MLNFLVCFFVNTPFVLRIWAVSLIVVGEPLIVSVITGTGSTGVQLPLPLDSEVSKL